MKQNEMKKKNKMLFWDLLFFSGFFSYLKEAIEPSKDERKFKRFIVKNIIIIFFALIIYVVAYIIFLITK